MSDIPEDIDRTATDIVRARCPDDEDREWFLYLAIATALTTERERGAKIAKGWGDITVANAIRSLDKSEAP